MINIPQGYKFIAKAVGQKTSGESDFAVILSDVLASASGVFTKNTFCGENIEICRETVKKRKLQGVFVTSGIANVATGDIGRNNVYKILDKFSEVTNIDIDYLLNSSTGKIGPQLEIEKILKGFDSINNEYQSDQNGAQDFAKAIMTTDLKPKIRSVVIRGINNQKVTLTGICKGSGMIEPNMATMLAYFITDAKISDNDIHNVLVNAVDQSFNAISVDTDTSTSDSVVIMANGLSGEVDLDEFQNAFNALALDLAKDIVRDGEGASKLLTVKVTNAQNTNFAKRVAKSIVNSPLVKSAIYGQDPNWGRIIMAIGKVFEMPIKKDDIEIYFGDEVIFANNNEISQNFEKVREYLANDEICITVKLSNDISFKSSFTAYGCDLTEGYIDINAHYST